MIMTQYWLYKPELIHEKHSTCSRPTTERANLRWREKKPNAYSRWWIPSLLAVLALLVQRYKLRQRGQTRLDQRRNSWFLWTEESAVSSLVPVYLLWKYNMYQFTCFTSTTSPSFSLPTLLVPTLLALLVRKYKYWRVRGCLAASPSFSLPTLLVPTRTRRHS
jgi:hypothetical protein